jgi:hypothetical protein
VYLTILSFKATWEIDEAAEKIKITLILFIHSKSDPITHYSFTQSDAKHALIRLGKKKKEKKKQGRKWMFMTCTHLQL